MGNELYFSTMAIEEMGKIFSITMSALIKKKSQFFGGDYIPTKLRKWRSILALQLSNSFLIYSNNPPRTSSPLAGPSHMLFLRQTTPPRSCIYKALINKCRKPWSKLEWSCKSTSLWIAFFYAKKDPCMPSQIEHQKKSFSIVTKLG